MNTLSNCLMAAVIALALGAAYKLDGPSETEAAQDVADELAMREACGENSGHYRLNDGRIQCLTKHARKVGIK